MKTIFSLLALLIAGSAMAAEVPDTPPANPYMRCAAINSILNSQPEDRKKELLFNFKLNMEIHAKWAGLPYIGDYPRYKADVASTMKALQEELQTGRLSGDAFAEEFGNCLSLQARTMATFLACLQQLGVTDENKLVCMQKAVEL